MDINEIDPELKKLASRYVAYYFLTQSSGDSAEGGGEEVILSLLTK